MPYKMSKKCSTFAPDIHKITNILSHKKKKKAMRRIKFLQPVESMRGNLSGAQNLLYPTNDNSAWEAPSGKRSYATNYKTRYIGAQRSKDGMTYFAVKERTAVNNSSESRQAQALFGGSISLANILMHNPSSLLNLQTAYGNAVTTKNFRQWVIEMTRKSLENYGDLYFYGVTGAVFIYENPFIKTHAASAIVFPTITDFSIITKFWTQLSGDGLLFRVNGITGVAHTGDDFNTVIESSYNVLGLSVDGDDYVRMGNLLLKYNNAQVSSSDTVHATDYGVELAQD